MNYDVEIPDQNELFDISWCMYICMYIRILTQKLYMQISTDPD